MVDHLQKAIDDIAKNKPLEPINVRVIHVHIHRPACKYQPRVRRHGCRAGYPAGAGTLYAQGRYHHPPAFTRLHILPPRTQCLASVNPLNRTKTKK